MNDQQSLAKEEADFLAWLSVSAAAIPQANEHSHGPVLPDAQSQVQQPAQLPGAPLRQLPLRTPPQEDPFALPPLEDTAWNEFQQDAGQWQPGDPFHPAAPAMTVDQTFAFWDDYFDWDKYYGEQQEGMALPHRTMPQARRPAFSAPQQLGPGAGSPVAPSDLPIDHMTDLSKQVCLEVVDRVNANGAGIDKNGLTAGDAQLILALKGSPAELAVLEEEFQTLVQPQIQGEAYQPYQPADQLYQSYQPQRLHQSYQLYQPEQIDLTTLPDQFDQANTATDADKTWFPAYQRQQSPARLADGTATPTTATQFHNKHDRVHLRVKCFPCFIGKRKCDRENQPNNICSECANRAARFPDIFDPNVICVKDETNAFKEFKAARVGNHGKAKALGDDDWGARKQARQEKKAAEKMGEGRSPQD